MIPERIHLTADEAQQYNELEELIKQLMHDFSNLPNIEQKKAIATYQDAADRQNAIISTAKNRYITSIVGNYSAIINAVTETLNAYTKEDYKEQIADMREFTRFQIEHLEAMKKEEKNEQKKDDVVERLREQKDNYSNLYGYNYESVQARLKVLTGPEATALLKSSFSFDEYNRLINKKAASFYTPRRGKKKEIAIIEPTFTDSFLPLLNGPLINDMLQISRGTINPDPQTKIAIFTTKEGRKITIENADKIKSLSVSMHKILHAAVARLTSTNYYDGDGNTVTVNPTVEISLMEYGEKNLFQLTPRTMETPEEQAIENARARERLKKFKQGIGSDLSDWEKFTWSGEETKGKNAGNHRSFRILSSHDVTDTKIEISFDIKAAIYLINAPLMQYPTALFRHDNRKLSAYMIGYKLAMHNSNDNNFKVGTANTLAVNSLLTAAPEIPSYEYIIAHGQRNWKDKIKRPLETALDENITVGLLRKWEYRDPKTGKTYTSETAQLLTWIQYSRLMVDFIIIDAPEQSERRSSKALKKATVQISDTQPEKRKRGRPRKVPQEKL